MNMHVNPSQIVLPLRQEARLLPASIAPLGQSLCAVFFDMAKPKPTGVRLTALLDGVAPPSPVISTSLSLGSGGSRHVLILGRQTEALEGHRLVLALGPRDVAGLDPNRLQPARVECQALVAGLTDAGRHRLLKLLLTAGAAVPEGDERGAFAANMADLLERIGVPEAGLLTWTRLGSTQNILSYRLSGPYAGGFADLIALMPGRAPRISGFRHFLERSKNGTVLHLVLPAPKGLPSAVVALGPEPVLLPMPKGECKPRPMIDWLEDQSTPVKVWAHDLMSEWQSRDCVAAATLAEIRGGTAAAPEVRVRHLSATDAGVLMALEIDDREDLLAAIVVQRGTANATVTPSRDISKTSTQFLALPRQDWLKDACRVILLHRSGRRRVLFEGTLAVYAGQVAEFDPGSAIPLAKARLSLPRRRLKSRAETFGKADTANLALVASLGETLDLVRTRAAMLFAERGAKSVEVVCHAPEGRLAEAARGVLAQTAAVYGITHRLVTVPTDATPSEQLLAALATVTAPTALVMGADILPRQGGWLSACRAAMRRPDAAMLLGPAADAYGETGTRPNRSTALDCVALSRDAFERLADFTPLYSNPEIVLSELAARLRAEGRTVRAWNRFAFARYRDAVEADPLERAVDAAALICRLTETGSPEVRS